MKVGDTVKIVSNCLQSHLIGKRGKISKAYPICRNPDTYMYRVNIDGRLAKGLFSESDLAVDIEEDIDLCNGMDCPIKSQCRRYADAARIYDGRIALWWVDPSYDKKTNSCTLFLKRK